MVSSVVVPYDNVNGISMNCLNIMESGKLKIIFPGIYQSTD